MRIERRIDGTGTTTGLATDADPRFSFIALAHVLYVHIRATELEPFTVRGDEGFILFGLPDGLVVRLSHRPATGTTLAPASPEMHAQFEKLSDDLGRVELPTRWTPIHVSLLELGDQLPGIRRSLFDRWAEGFRIWLRAVSGAYMR